MKTTDRIIRFFAALVAAGALVAFPLAGCSLPAVDTGSPASPSGPVDPDGPSTDPDKPSVEPSYPDEPYDPQDERVTATFNVGREARLAGVYNPGAQRVDTGSLLTEPALTRAGYKVSGWYAEDGDTAWDFSSDKLTKNTTLFARWESDVELGYTLTPGALYIHYLREDGNYAGWHIWAWQDGSAGQWFDSIVATDDTGAVYEVSPAVCASGKVGFIVAKGDWEKKDGEANNFINIAAAQNISGTYHWYCSSGNVAKGSGVMPGSSGAATTEPPRASRKDVDRSYAQALPLADTVAGYDDTGVGYQIFVASFCDSDGDGIGDIRGIIKRLDYLKDLGVDVLWLTPVQSSNSIHGYDCYDYYSIDPKFGTNADYRELVYRAHGKGMKVIMDLVVNHTSPSNEWFIKSKAGVVETVTYQDGTTAEVHYRDFYRWQNGGGTRYYGAGDGWYYYSSFGSSMPELNYDYQAARNAMADVALYWMGYGLDGFRMDAIKHVFMLGESDEDDCETGAPNDTGWQFNLTKDLEFFREFNYRLKRKYKNCYLLGEQLCGDPTYVAPFYSGMDSLFDFQTFYDLPGQINEGKPAQFSDNINANFAEFARYRGGRPINCMISSNHDVPRLSSKLTGDKAKLYFAIMMSLPGLPWIYYGDELGLKNNGSGDNAYRQSMRWTDGWEDVCTVIGYGNANDGVASVASQQTDPDSLLRYVKKLTALRAQYPALIHGDAQCSVTDNGLLKVTVSSDGVTVTSYHNMSGSALAAPASGEPVLGTATVAAYGSAFYVTDAKA